MPYDTERTISESNECPTLATILSARCLIEISLTMSVLKQILRRNPKNLLCVAGYQLPSEDTVISTRWINAIQVEKLDPDTAYVFELYKEQWLTLVEHIKLVDKRLTEQAEQQTIVETIYRSAPGIGKTHARILANELGDMSHFSNEKRKLPVSFKKTLIFANPINLIKKAVLKMVIGYYVPFRST